MGRREARDTAMTLLYSFQFHRDNPSSQVDYFNEDKKRQILKNDEDRMEVTSLSDKDFNYIDDVVNGVIKNEDEIDELITKFSRDWAFGRIPKTDIAILQLCIYEMIYRDDIPRNVSINEAVELAKKYGHDDSSSFVNGILGSVFRNLEEGSKGVNEPGKVGAESTEAANLDETIELGEPVEPKELVEPKEPVEPEEQSNLKSQSNGAIRKNYKND